MTPDEQLSLDELDPELLALIGASARAVAAAPGLRERLLLAVSSDDPRVSLAGFSGRLQRLYDLGPQAVDDVLAAITRPDRWERYVDGVTLFHFEPGPRERDAAPRVDAGLVRFAAGVEYPRHRHVGDETMLVLRGGLVDDASGRRLVAGDVLHQGPGTAHGLRALPDEDCVAAVLLRGGLPEFV